jgi:hypothetical protein
MRKIELTQDQFALIDDEDFDRVNQFKWAAQKRPQKYKDVYIAVRSKQVGYINGKQKFKRVFMHRYILDVKDDMQVDHINGNPLDNRKENLRLVNNRQNGQNRHHVKTSKYPGVSRKKNRKSWIAQIQINGKIKYLGSFKTEIEAYNAYKKAERGD